MPRPHVAPFPREGRIETAAGWCAERLRQARKSKGLSQEALALAAELSPRHLSFLETGRAAPSEEMVHRLMGVLDVPLPERNRILVAEGWESRYPDPEGVPTVAEQALRLTFEAHEPFPAVLLSEFSEPLQPSLSGLFEETYHPEDERTREVCRVWEAGPARVSPVAQTRRHGKG